jgi:predicted RNA-binding Zn ribbon-like protein
MSEQTPAGQWIVVDKHRWWFESGSVALDFAYTGGFTEGAATIDTPAALDAWIAERFPGVAGAASDRDLRDAVALRASIARIATAIGHARVPAAEDVDVVNLFAATADIPPALSGGSRQAGRSRARVGQSLSVMAREAVELFAGDNTERIRECAADDCELLFYDESRSNNRRWCSMQRCGNRAKVRAHRGRATAD